MNLFERRKEDMIGRVNVGRSATSMQKAIMELSTGATRAVLATDPRSVADREAVCRIMGDELVEKATQGDIFGVAIRRLGSADGRIAGAVG